MVRRLSRVSILTGDEGVYIYSGARFESSPSNHFTSNFDLKLEGSVVNLSDAKPYALGDFDGDGLTDIFWKGCASSPFCPIYFTGQTILSNMSSPGSVLSSTEQWDLGGPSNSVNTVGDLNLDGLDDLLYLGGGQARIAFDVNDTVDYVGSHNFSKDGGHVGDLTDDGINDIVLCALG